MLAAGRRAGLHGGAGEHDQVGDLAALQRQLEDALVVDDRADARAADVDERRRGLDRDRLLERAEPSTALTVGVPPTCRTMPVCT